MWIPKTEDEIVAAVRSGSLEETTIFDAKRELPDNKSNVDIAKDVASMANDGGVLLYGVGEDEHKRPTVLNPIFLAGQAERINNIARTSIAEPPAISISTIPTVDDPSKGYIIVVIPPSERAPHMVDHRYYGRTAKGNTPLNEGEVARLYERRQRWEIDCEKLLDEEIQRAPFPPHREFAYLHIIAQPVFRTESLLERAVSSNQAIQELLSELVVQVGGNNLLPRSSQLDFFAPPQWIRRAEGFLGKLTGFDVQPEHTLNLQIDVDGTCHLFCGRAAQRGAGDTFGFNEYIVAANTAQFLALLGILYAKTSYVGLVDIGVALTGLKGSKLTWSTDAPGFMPFTPYDRDEYRRTMRVSALTLKDDPIDVARRLLMPLFNAISQGQSDPFLLWSKSCYTPHEPPIIADRAHTGVCAPRCQYDRMSLSIAHETE